MCSSDLRAHPDVLELRWLIYSHHEQWDACLDITSAIVKMAPDRVSGWVHKAISLRRANGGGFENAKALLLEAAKLFPDDDTVQYNRSEERRVVKECRSRWSPYH